MSASGWAEWLVAQGQADAESVGEAERVLEAAALQPGDTVLDVGAGLGLLSLAAHDRIGEGWVIAVDPSPAVLEELLHIAHETGAAGLMYLVGDAEVLPLPDASVDAVVLRSVLVHVADTRAAAGELARVTRPGGRLSLREPLDRESVQLSNAIDWTALGELGERVVALSDELDAVGPAPRLDAGTLAADLAEAGFTDVDAAVEDQADEWRVTAESAAARLDAVTAPGAPSLRERWEAAFSPAEVAALVAHLGGLEGRTVTVRRPQLFLSARRR